MTNAEQRGPRTFYWVWFGVFTSVSVIANAWHAGVKAPAYFAALNTGDTEVLWKAWKTAGDLPPAWFTLGAVALGALMPIALAFGSHALANPRPNVSDIRKRVNFALTGATVSGAFILSFLAMQDLSMMLLGLSAWTAAIVPIAVDIAIVSALAELVARSPEVQDSAVERRVTEHVEALNVARQSDMGRFTAQAEAAREADLKHLLEQLDANREADRGALHASLTMQLTEQLTGHAEAIRDALTEQLVVQRPTRESSHAPRSLPRAEPLVLSRDASEVAAELAATGSFDQPAEVIARALELAIDGLSQRKVSEALTAEMPDVQAPSSSTVRRIVNAAKGLETNAESAA